MVFFLLIIILLTGCSEDPATKLNSTNPDDRRKAVADLAQSDNNVAIDPIVAALKDRDASVRYEAAYALGKMGGDKTVQALLQAVADSDAAVRRKAAQSLAKIGDPQIQVFAHAVINLEASDAGTRLDAVDVLGKQSFAETVHSLLTALKDPDVRVRQAAGIALANLGTGAVKSLIRLLGNDDPIIRYKASQILVQVGVGALNDLEKAMDDRNWKIRYESAKILQTIGSPPVNRNIMSKADRSVALMNRHIAPMLMTSPMEKRCGVCGTLVPESAKPGDRCPVCETVWRSEQNFYH